MKHITYGPYNLSGTCVAFGAFDGMHTGHRAITEKLAETAKAKSLTPVLVSFDADSGTAKLLSSEKEKLYLLGNAPIEAFLSLPPRALDAAFIKEVLVRQLGAKAVVMGQNHEELPLFKSAGGEHGFDVVECEVVKDDGLPVSSQLVTDALAACRMDDATRLLGHPHIVMGEVVRGKQLGRTVGQPTANIDFTQNKMLPPDGSYVTVTIVDGVRRVGLTNIGKRPTVDNYDYSTIENHILDFSGNLYGKQLVVEFHRFIRGVEKFDSLAAIQAQVAKDVQSIRDYIDSVG